MLNGQWPDGKQPADWNAQLRGGDATGSVGTPANAGSRAQSLGDEGDAMMPQEEFSPGVFGAAEADGDEGGDMFANDVFGNSMEMDMGGVFNEELGFEV